eukprot:TRINITY_DN80434_c0_g1_i1.p1 TRINITY_DN80434_c0_g1~~TRINITY_DN80434_c0_g1_i1.p1  ORF type:complete len:271 (+),score=58.85 TRINITY_DN80434_c0_g1_i1:95-907(+)
MNCQARRPNPISGQFCGLRESRLQSNCRIGKLVKGPSLNESRGKSFWLGCWTFLAFLLPQSAAGATPYGGPTFTIIDAKADIRELDVGDLNDMEADVPYPFLEHLKELEEQKSRKKAAGEQPSMEDIMKDPMAFAGGGGGTSMCFAQLDIKEAEKTGKEGTDILARTWSTMLSSGGVNVQIYAVDPGSILIVTQKAWELQQVKSFVMDHPTLDFFEVNQQRSYPNGRTKPLIPDEQRRKRLNAITGRLDTTPPKKVKKESKSKTGKGRPA